MSTKGEGSSDRAFETLPEAIRDAVSAFQDRPLSPKQDLVALIHEHAEAIEKSVYGFDDAAELINLIVEYLGRPDLAIHI